MKREGGMTLLALMFVLAVAAFFAIIGFRLLPAYMEYFTVKRIISDLAQNPDLRSASPRDIQVAFDRRATTEYLSTVKGSDLQVGKGANGITISANWEQKVAIIANISALVEFQIEK
ncbi:MAG: DUF4845 domain-containing protein [Betaproteobacteria bacterium]|nr:DUF4845 domain-containing protein [Betaproteobacteria bacterium]